MLDYVIPIYKTHIFTSHFTKSKISSIGHPAVSFIDYYNTNKAADDLVDESLVVPDSVTKGEIVQNVSQEAEQEYNKIWTEFKAACD